MNYNWANNLMQLGCKYRGKLLFKLSDVSFMSDEMKIDVSSIESKLNDPVLANFKDDFIQAIEYFIEEIIKFKTSGKVSKTDSFEKNEAVSAIDLYTNTLSEKIENQAALQVLDTLRHAFAAFAFNGLHQLYTRQENECWYPKIILDKVLTPNDIDSLPEFIRLYRGCSVNEYDTGEYGQAWTTSIDRAKDFAYNHYQGQDWFNIDDRVVLKTVYSRDNVLFSDQSVEFEVVIDVSKLGKVRPFHENPSL